MPAIVDPSDIAHTIQIAIPPVFMLAGIGSPLGVVVHRLGRVVDRARVIEAELADLPAAEHDRAVIALHSVRVRTELLERPRRRRAWRR